jgi:putative ABC transport system permease protein
MTEGMTIRPPRRAERVLARAFGDPVRAEAILGDLHEEYVPRAAASVRAAWLWYWSQALRLSTRLLVRHALDRLRRPRAGPAAPAQPPGDPLMRTLGPEIRHAFRAILKRPGMSAVIVLTLALGIGANAAVFALVDALVFRPFPFPDVDRIVMVVHARDGQIDRRASVSPADFLDLRRQTDAFEHLAALAWWDANLIGRDEPERVQGFMVSTDLFAVLGVRPALGRGFLAGDDTPGRHRRVVLGYGLWQRRFGSDPSIVGRSITIDGSACEVVGVAPAGFDFPMGAQVWSPIAFDPKTAANRTTRYLTVLGRLAAGRTLEDAKAQVALATERLERQYSESNKGLAGRVYTLAHGMRDVGLGPILSMWQASALFVLLIACVNVANLLLARGAERQREMAVRLAIGASPWRVARSMLIESLWLALLAAPAAVASAWAAVTILRGAMPAHIARFVAGWDQIDVDGRLLVATVLLAMLTALLFGIVPAVQCARPKLAESLKDGGRAGAGSARIRLRRSLVMAQMALALPLLAAAGLSVLTVHRYWNGPQGYDPDRLLTMQVVLADGRYHDAATRLRFTRNVVERLAALPGVRSAAAINTMPALGSNSGGTIEIDGQPVLDRANMPRADYRVATPRVFETLGIPLLKGRGIVDSDREETQPVAVVSASLAERHWPGTDPIGRRLKLEDGPWITIVGVAGDVIHDWFARRNYPTVYRPFAQAPSGSMSLLVRTVPEPVALAAAARGAVRAEDPAQPVFDIKTMREALTDRTVGLRYVAGIMGVLGALALVLSIVGVYGVMACLVAQRTHEIGVRIALGATRADVLRLTLAQTGRLTAAGAGVGIALALALTRLIEAGLLGVTRGSPLMLAAVASLLVTAALLAGCLPARRAAGIDPIAALRQG